MAITIDTVASVRVVPDLSAFTQASEDDIGDVVTAVLGDVVLGHLAAQALLEHFWIVPKT